MPRVVPFAPMAGQLQPLNASAPRLWLLVGVLGLAVFASALAVVYSRHWHRTAYQQLEQQQRLRDELEIEWRRLQLEEAALASQARVEQIASERLELFTPPMSAVEMVEP